MDYEYCLLMVLIFHESKGRNVILYTSVVTFFITYLCMKVLGLTAEPCSVIAVDR